MHHQKPVVYPTIDLNLTPRFWKGELIYDGRKPISVYTNPVVQTGIPIDQQSPYPSESVRSLEPSDGLLYKLTKIRNIKGGRGIKMLVCVTLYNQGIDYLDRTLIGIWKNVRKLVEERGLSSREVAVIIIQDGIMKLQFDKITRKYSTVVKFFQKLDFEAGKTSCTLLDRIGAIQQEIDNYERKQMGEFVIKNNGLPPTVPRNVALLYQAQWRPSVQNQKKYNFVVDLETDPYLQLFGCFKHLNAKKLSSHLWFFQGFCRLLTPQYCTLIDVGTEPSDDGLINFLNALEADPDVGGVSGFMTLDIDLQNVETALRTEVVQYQDQVLKYDLEQCCYPVPILSTIGVFFMAFFDKLFSCFMSILNVFTVFHQLFSVQRAQLFQYNYSHMVDKNFESCFGYLNVLPGAWSAYRYKALSQGNRYEQNLLEKKYLKIVLDPNFNERDFREANMYLAEDRILCLGIYCQKNSKYFLKYVPQAMAKTDPMDDLVTLMDQRRRWINSSYFAFDYVFRNYSYDVRDSTHPWSSKSIFLPIIMMLTKASLLNTYVTPALYFFALYTSLFESYEQIVIPTKNAGGVLQQSAWIIVPSFICFGYVIIVCVMIGICINKKAAEGKHIFIIVSGILGFYYLIMICIVVFYIAFNYFVSPTNSSAASNDPSSGFTVNLIKYLTVINFISLAFPVIMHLTTHTQRVIEMIDPRTLMSYLYYQAVYSHTLVIFAFCNIDNVTWGTKGIKDENGESKGYFNDKIQFVSSWIFWNTLLSFCLIFLNSIFQSQNNKAIMLISLGAYSTFIVFLKFLFALIYHLYQYTSKSWLRKLYYPEREKEKIQEQLQYAEQHLKHGRNGLKDDPDAAQHPFSVGQQKVKENKPVSNFYTPPSNNQRSSSSNIIRSTSNIKKKIIEQIKEIPEQNQYNMYTDRVLHLQDNSQIKQENELPMGSNLSQKMQEQPKVLEPKRMRVKTKIYSN